MSSDTQFKTNVREYIALDDQMKEAREAAKIVKARHGELKKWIIDKLCEMEIPRINISGTDPPQYLKLGESQPKPRGGPAVIKDRFRRYFERCAKEKKRVDPQEMYEYVFGKEGAVKEEPLPEPVFRLSRLTEKPKKPPPAEPTKRKPTIDFSRRLKKKAKSEEFVEPTTTVSYDVESAAVDPDEEEEKAMGMDT